MSDKEFHPIQWHPEHPLNRASTDITLRAYEVYKHCHGEQQALITGWCRGGFGINELIAFLYARSFPKEEWKKRADEAFAGLVQKDRGP